MPQGLGWLDSIVGMVRCARCGATYPRRALTVVGENDGYVFLRCECDQCSSEGIAVVTVRATDGTPRSGRPPLSVDDVLAAHEILREYRGTVGGLFSTRDRPR